MPITQLCITLVFFHYTHTVTAPEHYPHKSDLGSEPKHVVLSCVLLPIIWDTQ